MSVEEALQFSRRSRRSPAPADAARRRPRLHQARPAGDDALGREAQRDEACIGTLEGRDREDALHPRRAGRRACTSPTSRSSSRRSSASLTRQHDDRHPSTTSTSSNRPTGSSISVPRAGEAGGESSRSARPNRSRGRGQFDGRVPQACLARARAAAAPKRLKRAVTRPQRKRGRSPLTRRRSHVGGMRESAPPPTQHKQSRQLLRGLKNGLRLP